MEGAIKVAGWLIAGAVAVHLLTNTNFPSAITAITGGFGNLISAMLGNGAQPADAGGAAQAKQLGLRTA